MADVNIPHAGVGVVTVEGGRLTQFNDEATDFTQVTRDLQIAPTKEFYKWMVDVTDCVNNQKAIIEEQILRIDDLTTEVNDLKLIVDDHEARLMAGGL